MKIENIIGKPVQDQNFFGRDAELEELQAISEREHVLLLAPRRVGKTSLLHALVKRVDGDGSAIGVYASVAAATNEAQFVQTVLNAIYATKRGRKLKPSIVARALGLGRGVKSVKIAGSGLDLETRTPPWQEDADRAFAAIVTSKRPLLILIDELPVLVLALGKSDPSGARVRAFLQWFRNLRQHPAGATTLRFVLAGSIGIDNVTRRHHLTDTINDLRIWPLGPFEPPAAHEFLGRLATSYKLELDPVLANDGYLVEHDGRWRFRSGLLRRYWLRHVI